MSEKITLCEPKKIKPIKHSLTLPALHTLLQEKEKKSFIVFHDCYNMIKCSKIFFKGLQKCKDRGVV